MFGFILTPVQKILLVIGVLSFTAGSGTLLADIFSPLGAWAPIIVKVIVSLCSFVGGLFTVMAGLLTGQAAQVKAVQAMPGVESITVNAQANQALAQLAVDQAQPKIEVAAGAEKVVAASAKGT